MSFLFLLIIMVGLTLSAWRHFDHRADREAINRLVSVQPARPANFDLSMIADLPEPARRYFLYTIEPGTPLYKVANITMAGRFGIGTKAKPNYLDMTANQTLAMPDGFVWKIHARRGPMGLSGSDSESWTRFWLMGLLPVARMGGDPDHTRSALGRYVAEAVFWTPAAVIFRTSIGWKWVDEDCAYRYITYSSYKDEKASQKYVRLKHNYPILFCN